MIPVYNSTSDGFLERKNKVETNTSGNISTLQIFYFICVFFCLFVCQILNLIDCKMSIGSWRGRDRMVVRFTTICAISTCHH